ncbi:potassium voltage-gated channel protein Shaw-like [Mercenaria mercenaria]|uniref:potassium voltage-gated channel protein Shaw-like n=1 Tax=Mercenaria mercenaria TaxID=6596 RepID=UPI00234FAFB9|nr:potassium voltage-gated channel protein Shaw-like [Mercenaria mercenaria]
MEKLCNLSRREIVRINVGGTVFQCCADILKTFPESFLASLEKQMPNHDNSEYIFDRNPLMFAYILDSFRKGSVHLPKDICGTTFMEELEFWEVSLRHVAPCCLEALYKSEDDMSTIQKLLKDYENKTNVFLMRQKDTSIWATFISLLIVLSTFAEALSTVPAFDVNYTESEKQVLRKIGLFLNWDNATYKKILLTKPHPYLKLIDFLCNIVITLEYLISFIVCPNKKTFIISFIRICIVFGYLSYWTAFIMQSSGSKMFESETAIKAYTVLSYLTILKVTRLFYLAKRVPAFGIIGLTLRSSSQELKLLILMLGILVSIFGVLMFVAEYQHQSSKITNIFIGMYWALITVTTVGYGDYVPISPAGHVIAGACAVCGILILALPIGIVASSFCTFYNYRKYGRRHFQISIDGHKSTNR